jgi:hypothetical protein
MRARTSAAFLQRRYVPSAGLLVEGADSRSLSGLLSGQFRCGLIRGSRAKIPRKLLRREQPVPRAVAPLGFFPGQPIPKLHDWAVEVASQASQPREVK